MIQNHFDKIFLIKLINNIIKNIQLIIIYQLNNIDLIKMIILKHYKIYLKYYKMK